MTTFDSGQRTAIRRAAVRATRAPSVHNTQPWRFVRPRRRLEIMADWIAQLTRARSARAPVADELRVRGASTPAWRSPPPASAVIVERFPDPLRPDLVARDRTPVRRGDGRRSGDLRAWTLRSTPGRPTAAGSSTKPCPTTSSTPRRRGPRRGRGAVPHPPSGAPRALRARLSQLADKIENADPAYRAEMRRWTSDDPRRVDGVPAFAVPHVDGTRHDDIPMRDFDTRGMGWLPDAHPVLVEQCLLLLGTNADNPAAWAQCGEALERVLLEIARRGLHVEPADPGDRDPAHPRLLRDELGLQMHPHILLRVGRAPATTPTRRRRLVDVLAVGG